jgi:hypothetical protein
VKTRTVFIAYFCQTVMPHQERGTSRSANRLLKRSRFKSLDRVERMETDMKTGSEDSKAYFRVKRDSYREFMRTSPIGQSLQVQEPVRRQTGGQHNPIDVLMFGPGIGLLS